SGDFGAVRVYARGAAGWAPDRRARSRRLGSAAACACVRAGARAADSSAGSVTHKDTKVRRYEKQPQSHRDTEKGRSIERAMQDRRLDGWPCEAWPPDGHSDP